MPATDELIARAENARHESLALTRRFIELIVRGKEICHQSQALGGRLAALCELEMLNRDFRVVTRELAKTVRSCGNPSELAELKELLRDAEDENRTRQGLRSAATAFSTVENVVRNRLP